MADGQLVTGDGWISDDSSFYGKYCLHCIYLRRRNGQSPIVVCLSSVACYQSTTSTPLTDTGSENEQDRLHSLCNNFRPRYFLTTRQPDLNTKLATLRAQSRSETMSAMETDSVSDVSVLKKATKPSNALTNNKLPNFLLDRKAMEEARLARLGKRPREPSPESVLFNPGQGSPDAWQLGESVDEFIKRLPPLTTSVITCPWIWVHNPHFDARDKNKVTSHRADEFRSREMICLVNRSKLESKFRPKTSMDQGER
jgi:hypothetical protein